MEQKNNEIVDLSCPVADVQKIVHGKWSMVIIYFLGQGTLRFREIKRRVPYITEANLTKELRMLEEYRLVHREVYKQVPPKVEYSLTKIGRDFLPVIESLANWAEKYREYNKDS